MNPNRSRPQVVIKVGGEVLLTEKSLNGLVQNVHSLIKSGWKCLVLHGGGPQISRLQKLHGLIPRKVGGRRITSPQDLIVVMQAVCGEANVAVTSAFLRAGVNAFGCHGASGRLISACKRPPKVVSGGGASPIDFGEVGDVTDIDTRLLLALQDLGLVPVVATLGVDDTGRIFNINADTTVIQIATCLQAELLILVTEIGGIYKDPQDINSRIESLHVDKLPQLISKKVIQGGMIPKVEEAAEGLRSGIKTVAIVGSTNHDAFLSVAVGSREYGTRIHC